MPDFTRMSDPLTFSVEAEYGLRGDIFDLVLGTNINQVLYSLQQHATACGHMHLLFSKVNPCEENIRVRLADCGIILLFDGQCQLLKRIEIEALDHLILEYNETDKMYIQSWRGLSFCFPTTNSVQVTTGFSPTLHSLKYESNLQPKLSTMAIYNGPAEGEPDYEELKEPDIYFNGSNRTRSVSVLVENRKTKGERECEQGSQADLEVIDKSTIVQFGMPSATVMSKLGAPSRLYFKTDRGVSRDKNDIDYFYNYFTMGLDFLFDGTTKTLKKILLHTNLPGHFDFGIYNRCNFEVIIGNPPVRIDNLTCYGSIASLFDYDGSPTKPVVLTHNNDNERNPFGPTYCYGYPGLILEVMETSRQIATVTLYEVDD